MFVQRTLLLGALIALFQGISRADDVFLQIEEVRDSTTLKGEADVLRSLETNITVGREFYIRSVTNGVQWLLRGNIEKRHNDTFEVKYVFTATEIRQDPSPRTKLEGDVPVQLRRKNQLGSPDRKADTKYTLTVHPIAPQSGFRAVSSGFSARLIDEAGEPVANADVGLYAASGDSVWELIVGPVKSDANGIFRISEGRESLPELTLFAEHKGRALVTAANLDRNQISEYKASEPSAITMRGNLKNSPRPAK